MADNRPIEGIMINTKWVLVGVVVLALLATVVGGTYSVGHQHGVVSVPTATPMPTSTDTPTVTNTPTPTETATPTSTYTPIPTYTPYPTSTPWPTHTPQPTYTPGPDPEAEFLLGADMMCQYANYVVGEITGGAWIVGDCRAIIQRIDARDWYSQEDLRKTATPRPTTTPTVDIGTFG